MKSCKQTVGKQNGETSWQMTNEWQVQMAADTNHLHGEWTADGASPSTKKKQWTREILVMFANEKTPLRGSDGYMPYSFMGDRHGAFRRKVKQYQCFICASITLTFALLVVLALLSYPEAREIAYDDVDGQSNLLQQPLKKAILPTGADVALPKLGEENFIKTKSSRSGSEIVCTKSKYRSSDGACNNLAHPLWGSSGQPLKHLVPPKYCDGLSSPRCSFTKSELPSPYFITSKISTWNDSSRQQHRNDLADITKLLWGKFVYQDLINIPEYGPLEQLNLATSYIDGSNIYGYGNIIERKLRTFVDGGLIPIPDKTYNYSPLNKDEECQNGFLDFELFNKIMIKQHNSITSEFKLINPHWDDEKLYNEAKRIVTAQIQHVTYDQFLEYVIGEHEMEEHDLKPHRFGFNNKYDESVDPSVTDAFATAVFKSFFAKLPKAKIELKNDHCDFYAIAHGIQRGREYGLPGYIKWREYCGLHQPTDFDDLQQLMGINNTEILRDIYVDIDDIDLLVGIFSEIPVKGSMFSEVGMCLIVDQFKRLKVGDRYWYEVEMSQRFSEGQLMEIRKTTISKLLCDNLGTDGIFHTTNVSLECSGIHKINLTLWSEDGKIKNSPSPLVIDETPSQVILNLSNNNNNFKTVTIGQEVIYGSRKLVQSLNPNLSTSKNKTTVVKRSASFTIKMANITAITNGTGVYEVYNQKPPILLPLDRVIDPNAYTASTEISFMGAIDGEMLSGSFVVPLRNIDGTKEKADSLNVRFKSDISFKWGTTFELNGNEQYDCKVLFQSFTKSSNPNVNGKNILTSSNVFTEEAKINEQCTIMLVGMFYQRPFYCSLFPWWCLEGKLFYWSGDAKIVFKSIPIEPNVINLPKIKTGGLKSYSIKQKTENVKVDKLFASVTIVRAQISGSFDNNEDVIEVPVSPPMDINLNQIISPSAYDTSFEVTWSGTPIDDNSVVGKFSAPYYTEVGTAFKKMFNANFTFDIVYKYGGSIDIINPSKTYVCKVMFPSVKKSTLGNQKLSQSEILPVQTIKGKTPFGESCAIMLSGYFKTSSVLCYLTPWWCSDDKIFHWDGVAELTLKYKYNVTDSENNIFVSKETDTGLKNYQKLAMSRPIQYKDNDLEEKFCCGHRLGGKIRGGWIEIKNSGFFQTSKTVWSGELPTAIELPIFWKPEETIDQVELSDVYGHEVIWSCSIFQSTIQGSFLFPQYVGHGPPPSVNWIKGKFFMELIPEDNVSLYNIIVPGMSYRSRVIFRESHSPDPIPFSSPQKGGPTNEDVHSGTKAPLILLGKHSLDHKSFIWNGSFIIVFTKSASDFMFF